MNDSKFTILIADDNSNNLGVLSKIVDELGYGYRVANNGQLVIQSTKAALPDLILLDIHMPVMDGYDTCLELKSNPDTASIPVIFISALNDTNDKIKAFEMGGVDYITKPFRIEEVKVRIKTHLQLKYNTDLLNKTIEELKQAQSNLLHKEKMASLGVLTAGIAHEINNPINFIYSGINSLKLDYEDLEKVIKICNKIRPSDLGMLKELQELKEEININELMDTIPQTIEDIKFGATRTTEIVKNLSEFSRIDPNLKQTTNIHDGLNSTLVLLRNRISSKIRIEKNYGTDMPQIDGYGGQINQVFLNILSNAIDALNEEGEIIISTKFDNSNSQVYISIKDNGCGIPEDELEKVFDPFFTTKKVGDGTGLGLSISHGIINKHQGNIEVKSVKNKGTEFIINIPAKF